MAGEDSDFWYCEKCGHHLNSHEHGACEVKTYSATWRRDLPCGCSSFVMSDEARTWLSAWVRVPQQSGPLTRDFVLNRVSGLLRSAGVEDAEILIRELEQRTGCICFKCRSRIYGQQVDVERCDGCFRREAEEADRKRRAECSPCGGEGRILIDMDGAAGYRQCLWCSDCIDCGAPKAQCECN